MAPPLSVSDCKDRIKAMLDDINVTIAASIELIRESRAAVSRAPTASDTASRVVADFRSEWPRRPRSQPRPRVRVFPQVRRHWHCTLHPAGIAKRGGHEVHAFIRGRGCRRGQHFSLCVATSSHAIVARAADATIAKSAGRTVASTAIHAVGSFTRSASDSRWLHTAGSGLPSQTGRGERWGRRDGRWRRQ